MLRDRERENAQSQTKNYLKIIKCDRCYSASFNLSKLLINHHRWIEENLYNL
jgi:hypothetical protein